VLDRPVNAKAATWSVSMRVGVMPIDAAKMRVATRSTLPDADLLTSDRRSSEGLQSRGNPPPDYVTDKYG
jgi:hypothetical protein